MPENIRDNSPYPLRKTRLFEVSVFLLLIVPSMLLSFLAVKPGVLGFTLTAWTTILRDVALVGLIAYFLRCHGEPAVRLGWTSRNLGQEMALGLILFVPFLMGANLLEAALRKAGFSAPATPLPESLTPGNLPQLVLATTLVVVVAVAEETIFRGYLMLRFRELGAGRAGALVLSAFVFSLGHGYEGTAGVITVGVAGLVFGGIYLWRGSLAAPIAMHFLLNFTGIVLAPLLRR